jgi:GNAT superfamily N-acetyltransferase
MRESGVTALQPRLHTASAIRSDPALAHTITTFVNEGYRYKSNQNWHPDPSPRFPNPDSIHSELGDDGLFAVIYDPRNETRPIACAAMTRWHGDLEGYVAAGERGWEIKTVTTQVDWMRRGLAGRCVGALAERAVEDEDCGSERKVQIWVQAVEELNGAYWRKKGWVEVRAYQKPVGHWGSKLGYRLLVMLQEFERK